MEHNKGGVKVINLLTHKAQELIMKDPPLNELLVEVDRLLSNAPNEKTRKKIMQTLYQSNLNELKAKMNGILQLLAGAK